MMDFVDGAHAAFAQDARHFVLVEVNIADLPDGRRSIFGQGREHCRRDHWHGG
jgi:hypothetical protein